MILLPYHSLRGLVNSGPEAIPRTNMDSPTVARVEDISHSASICVYVVVYMELAQVLVVYYQQTGKHA